MHTDSAPHLDSTAAARLELSDEERIRSIRTGSFIEVDRTTPVLEALASLPQAPRAARRINVLLLGAPNSGKTAILKHFLKTTNGPSAATTQQPTKAVMIDAPPDGDRKDFYLRILEALLAEYNPASNHSVLRSQVIRLFRELDVKVLMIDEVHSVMTGTGRQQDLFTIELVQLSNATGTPIAAAGLEKAGHLLMRDVQLASRFKRMFLEPFKADKDLGMLLATMEKRLPLRHPSNLEDPRIVAEVARRSEGAIGDVCDLIEHCAIAVIKSAATPECITLNTIRDIDWQHPTARRAFTRVGRDDGAKAQREPDTAFALDHESSDEDSVCGSDAAAERASGGAATANAPPPSAPSDGSGQAAARTPARKGRSFAAKAPLRPSKVRNAATGATAGIESPRR